jgi:hypothetical protein
MPGGYLDVPEILSQTNLMVQSFSDSLDQHEAAVAEAAKGLLTKARSAGPYRPKGIR